jgi:hypothetical protein
VNNWVELVSMGFVGVMLLIALWPTDKTAAKVLRKWHVPDPTPEQVAESKVYLKRRRLLYPWLFIAITYGGNRVFPDEDYLVGEVMVTVLSGMLLAELIAALRPTKGVRREAVLVPRRVLDLVPPWGLVVFGVCAAGVLVLLALSQPVPVPGLIGMVLSVVVVAGALALAVRRPTSGDEAVDAAFRLRSARVALGLGVALTGVLSTRTTLTGYVLFAAVVLIGLGWNLVSPPPVSELPVRG